MPRAAGHLVEGRVPHFRRAIRPGRPAQVGGPPESGARLQQHSRAGIVGQLRDGQFLRPGQTWTDLDRPHRRERNREDDAAGRDTLDSLVCPILDTEARGLASHPDDGGIVANDVSERRCHGPRQQVHPAGNLVTLRGTAQHRELPEHEQGRQIGGVTADRHPRDRLGWSAARSKIFRPAERGHTIAIERTSRLSPPVPRDRPAGHQCSDRAGPPGPLR